MEGIDCGKGHGKWTKELWNVQTVEKDIERGQKIHGRSRLEQDRESGQKVQTVEQDRESGQKIYGRSRLWKKNLKVDNINCSK